MTHATLSWKNFENNVRELASFIWNTHAVPEHIAGVNFDLVLKPQKDSWVIIEVTENETLDKIRTDCAKLGTIKMNLFERNIYAKRFIVTRNTPTLSMRETGESNGVEVLSYTDFSKLFFDYGAYTFQRKDKPFGSSINPVSGDPDSVDYTPVAYENTQTHKTAELKDIAKMLLDRRKLILLGNYGTGKSRCLRELFFHINQSVKPGNELLFTLAINLKEYWGTQTAEEIIRRHFNDLGLSHLSDSIIKILGKENIVLLLDGFDEIGSQSWSDNTSRLRQIRTSSLQGIKDLISKTKGPVIISGREHYFNSDEEMFSSLGLNKSNTLIYKCKDEFSEEEMKNYLKNVSGHAFLPEWLPKRPLVCQIINSFDQETFDRVFLETSNASHFWKILKENLCAREARIRNIFDPGTISSILMTLADMTRGKIGNVGPISLNELNSAFEKVTGTPPVDEGVMLQRLLALGRISAENTDRQFIDYYILDGFRAESLIISLNENNTAAFNEKWHNALGKLGIEILANEMAERQSANHYLQYLKQSLDQQNTFIRGDILASLVYYADSPLDLNGIKITDTYITYLKFTHKNIRNFSLEGSIIEELDISDSELDRIILKGNIIKKVYGITSEQGLPEYLKDNQIESYEAVDNLTRIKSAKLSDPHKIFLSIIKKTFFQSGVGRKEETLYRGLGDDLSNKKLIEKILGKLVSEKILDKVPGKEGDLYVPKRHHSRRMKNIMNDLTLSKDPLWESIGKI